MHLDSIDGGSLRPQHKNVVMLRCAGMAIPAIARYMDCTEDAITKILHVPSVAKYMMQVEATYVNDLRPVASRVNKLMEDHSVRAATVVSEVMEQMHSREEIGAQRVALTSAFDILDRAGHKPKQRIEQASISAIHPDTIAQISQVLRELREDTAPTEAEPPPALQTASGEATISSNGSE